MLNLKDPPYNAAGDGSTDDSAAVQMWLDDLCASGATDTTGYVPSGIYMVLQSTGNTYTSLTATVLNTLGKLTIIGDGSSSIFRRNANTLPSASGGNPHFVMLSITNNAGTPLNVTIKGLTFDDQSSLQPSPSPSTNFQHCSALKLQPQDARGIANAHLEDLIFLNPVGDGVLFGGGAGESFGTINVVNVREFNRTLMRSGVCVTASYDAFNITNFNLESLQTEINSVDSGFLFDTNISNGTVRLCPHTGFDLSLKDADLASPPVRATCNISNVVAYGRVNLNFYDFNVVNCDFRINGAIRPIWGHYKFADSRIGTLDNTYPDDRLVSNITSPAYGLTFQNVLFHNDGGASSGTLLYTFKDENATPSGVSGVVFDGCDFSITTAIAASIRSGEFSFTRCMHRYDGTSQLAGSGPASISHGASDLAITKRVTIVDNFIDNTTAYLYEPPLSSLNGALELYSDNPRIKPGYSINWTRYDKIAPPYGSGSYISLHQVDSWNEGSTTTLVGPFPSTGRWVQGQKLYYADPASMGYVGCECVVSGNADGSSATGANNGASFQMFGKLEQGVSSVLEEDFLGPALETSKWAVNKGSNGSCSNFAVVAAPGGLARAVTGSGAGADMASNGVQINGDLNWYANQGGLAMEARVRSSSNGSVALFVGFTDQVAALEMPATLTGTTLTTNANDACGFLFDTSATTVKIWQVGVAATVQATAQNSNVGLASNTYVTLRVDISSAGVATFRINGKVYGTAMTGAVTPSTALTPVVAAFSRNTSTKNVDVDYISVKQKR